MKNYNPLKMWGSYVIFVIVILIIILTAINMKVACQNHSFANAFYDQINLGGPTCHGATFSLSQILSLPILIPALIIVITLGEKFALISVIISLLLYCVLGFLLGWGIHSLFRKFSK